MDEQGDNETYRFYLFPVRFPNPVPQQEQHGSNSIAVAAAWREHTMALEGASPTAPPAAARLR